jgi:hypothetical protein
MKPTAAATTPPPRVLDGARAWLQFMVLTSLAASVLTIWYEKALPAMPELRRMGHETAYRILVATAVCGSAAATAALPLVLSSVRRWAGLCVQGLAVWGSMLLVAAGGDWTRRFALAVLLPWACLAFCRCLTGPSSSLPRRVAQGCGFFLGGALSALFFVAVNAPIGTPARLTTWLMLVFALLLFWSPPLYFQGRAASEIFRLGPVARARDQTFGTVKWLGLLAISLGGAGVLQIMFPEHDYDTRHWRGFCTALVFALPLALRGGWRGLAVAVGLAVLVANSAAVARYPTDALWPIYFVVVGFSILGAIMGRVEWRQRLLRLLGFVAGMVAFAALALDTKNETVALVLGPALCWSGVFVVDYIKLRDRAAEREAAAEQGAHWSPELRRLVSTSRVEAVAVSLVAYAFAIPFIYVGSGIGRERPCWRHRYTDNGTPRRAIDGCGEAPRPELILDRETGLVISEETTGPDVQGALFDGLATRGELDGRLHLEYLNQLSALEELEPCYHLGSSVSVNRGCAGYRVHDVAMEAVILNNPSKPAETRIARKLTAEEARRLAGHPFVGSVKQERRKP